MSQSDPHEVIEMHPHLPPVDRSWTVGTVLASVTSVLSLLTMLGSFIWFEARIKYVTDNVPELEKQEVLSQQNIAVLQDQQRYADLHYAEIMTKLDRIELTLNKERSGK